MKKNKIKVYTFTLIQLSSLLEKEVVVFTSFYYLSYTLNFFIIIWSSSIYSIGQSNIKKSVKSEVWINKNAKAIQSKLDRLQTFWLFALFPFCSTTTAHHHSTLLPSPSLTFRFATWLTPSFAGPPSLHQCCHLTQGMCHPHIFFYFSYIFVNLCLLILYNSSDPIVENWKDVKEVKNNMWISHRLTQLPTVIPNLRMIGFIDGWPRTIELNPAIKYFPMLNGCKYLRKIANNTNGKGNRGRKEKKKKKNCQLLDQMLPFFFWWKVEKHWWNIVLTDRLQSR